MVREIVLHREGEGGAVIFPDGDVVLVAVAGDQQIRELSAEFFLGAFFSFLLDLGLDPFCFLAGWTAAVAGGSGVDDGSPFVAALAALPPDIFAAFGGDGLWVCGLVSGGPFCCQVGAGGGEVVDAGLDDFILATGALMAAASVCDLGFPFISAGGAFPPDFLIGHGEELVGLEWGVFG